MAAPRKRGRPVGTTKADSRRRNVVVRFSDAEYLELEAFAAAQVLPVSDVIRAAVKLAIARGEI
jgi:hypothetical protein